MGPGHSGKNATVFWLMRDMLDSMIWIDCTIYDTDTSFISHLIHLLEEKMGKKVLKNVAT